jgi:long-chain acyl-CoA synthetase
VSAGTLPGLLLDQARQRGTQVAVRSHGLGIWQPTTWAALAERVERVGDGLASLGVTAGSVVALVATNRVEWIVTDLAAQGLGAAVLALDPTSASPSAVSRAMQATSPAVVVVSDQEQYDKAVDGGAIGDAPVIVMDTRGLRHLDDAGRPDADRRMSFAALESLRSDGSWRRALASLTPDTVAVVEVDGAEVHRTDHATLLAAGDRIGATVGLGPTDELYPQHSFADPTERALSITGAMRHGLSLAIGQDDRLATLEITAVQPTLLHATPAWAASLATDLDRRVRATRGLKRLALRRGFRLRTPATTPRTPGFPPLRALGIVTVAAVLVLFALTPSANDYLRILGAIAMALGAGSFAVLSGISVPGPLRRRLGLTRTRAVVVSEPIGPEASEVLGALGLPVVTVGADANRSATPKQVTT